MSIVVVLFGSVTTSAAGGGGGKSTRELRADSDFSSSTVSTIAAAKRLACDLLIARADCGGGGVGRLIGFAAGPGRHWASETVRESGFEWVVAVFVVVVVVVVADDAGRLDASTVRVADRRADSDSRSYFGWIRVSGWHWVISALTR